ncbi:hypothetical protein GN244_ATG01244 [Phytophthora infestans]|uniref:Uncharacterized protein n=1 Tax=Phytophthora infestans TaxID=4787 RepID=A0A833SDC7_PHYIN|nr:hypothetical protein GN244_ATG01244 [Phytophthora infestans]KAF4149868.1 hypothetical protein GN958_ATG00941 [Phytophthora infestans]
MTDDHGSFSLLAKLLIANNARPSQQRTPLTLPLIHSKQSVKDPRRIAAECSPRFEGACDLTPQRIKH